MKEKDFYRCLINVFLSRYKTALEVNWQTSMYGFSQKKIIFNFNYSNTDYLKDEKIEMRKKNQKEENKENEKGKKRKKEEIYICIIYIWHNFFSFYSNT